MKIMRWRQKKHIKRRGLYALFSPITLIIVMLITIVSIGLSETASASKYDWLNKEYEKFMNATAASACAARISLGGNDKFIINSPGAEDSGDIWGKKNSSMGRLNCKDQIEDIDQH